MRLRYSISSEGKKVYTMKPKASGKDTLDAHYKFIKIRDVKTASPADSD